MREILKLVGCLAMTSFLAGCSLFPPLVLPAESEEPTEPIYLFTADFTEDTLGELPAGWTYINTYGYAEVIEDSEISTRRALRIVSERPSDVTTAFQLRGPNWDDSVPTAKVVAVQYQVKRILGGLFNLYVTSSAGHYTQIHITSTGQMRARDGSGEGTLKDLPVVLDQGWNTIRVELHREPGVIYVYVNDMETPVAGPWAFMRPLTSWERVRFEFLMGAAQSEIWYGDFKVWIVEE